VEAGAGAAVDALLLPIPPPLLLPLLPLLALLKKLPMGLVLPPW
jgi:hypothetical protein